MGIAQSIVPVEDAIPVESSTPEDIFNVVDPDARITGKGEKYRIDFKNRTPAQLEFCAGYILDVVLPLANKHNGKVFGGFVRDILIPLNSGTPLKECGNFKDVDLWFTTLEDAQAFANEKAVGLVKPHMIGSNRYSVSDCSIYEFNVNHELISKGGEPIAFTDIIIAPDLPVNDFDINRIVAWRVGNGKIIMESLSDVKLETLLDNAINKVVNMLPEYKDKININNYHSAVVLIRIKTRYLDRGWKVMVDGKELKPEYIDPIHFELNFNRAAWVDAAAWVEKTWNKFLEAE